MSKATKIWLIAASVLVLCGVILFLGVMAYLEWDFEKLSTVEYETNEHEIGEGFEDILVITDTADIVFVKSENEKTTVVCREEKNGKHLVAVKDGVLTIKLEDTKSWYDHIGINFETSKITVYLPEGEYGGLSVKLSTGDVDMSGGFGFERVKVSSSTGEINVGGISAGELVLSVSTGRVKVLDVACEGDITLEVTTGVALLEDVTCKDFTTKGNTGDVSLKNVVAAGTFSIKRSTGDVNFDACDASRISVKTSTGDVEGSFISEKTIFAQTDTGRVNVPDSVSGGRCDIITDTGDIKIHIIE